MAKLLGIMREETIKHQRNRDEIEIILIASNRLSMQLGALRISELRGPCCVLRHPRRPRCVLEGRGLAQESIGRI